MKHEDLEVIIISQADEIRELRMRVRYKDDMLSSALDKISVLEAKIAALANLESVTENEVY